MTSRTPAQEPSGGLEGHTLLTVRQAAERLGVHPKTMRRYIAQRRLPHWTLSKRLIRVREADVDALLTKVPTTVKRKDAK